MLSKAQQEGVEGGKLLGGPPKGVDGHVDGDGPKVETHKKGDETKTPVPVEETSADDVD